MDKVIDELLIDRMESNEEITFCVLMDSDFCSTAVTSLARDIFDRIRVEGSECSCLASGVPLF